MAGSNRVLSLLLCTLAGGLLLHATRAQERTGAPPAAEPPIRQSKEQFRKEYLLAPGDQIEVSVRRVPEASRTVMLRPDGFISLPMIGDIQAAGLTVNELKEQLTRSWSERLVEPEVTVIALQVRQPVVYVTGDVNNPTAVPLRNAATVMQAIALAGGFRRSAATKEVALIRLSDNGHVEALPLIASNQQKSLDLVLGSTLLKSDDIIIVPESVRSKFARFLEDFINRPLQGINAVAGTYATFKLIQIFNRQ